MTDPDQTKPDEAVDAPPVNPFASWVQEQRGGLLHSELSELLAQLTRDVVHEGKGGTLTLKITIAPSKAKYGPLVISDDVVMKAPQPERDAAFFYADEAGNLSRRDPRQPELPFQR